MKFLKYDAYCDFCCRQKEANGLCLRCTRLNDQKPETILTPAGAMWYSIVPFSSINDERHEYATQNGFRVGEKIYFKSYPASIVNHYWDQVNNRWVKYDYGSWLYNFYNHLQDVTTGKKVVIGSCGTLISDVWAEKARKAGVEPHWQDEAFNNLPKIVETTRPIIAKGGTRIGTACEVRMSNARNSTEFKFKAGDKIRLRPAGHPGHNGWWSDVFQIPLLNRILTVKEVGNLPQQGGSGPNIKIEEDIKGLQHMWHRASRFELITDAKEVTSVKTPDFLKDEHVHYHWPPGDEKSIFCGQIIGRITGRCASPRAKSLPPTIAQTPYDRNSGADIQIARCANMSIPRVNSQGCVSNDSCEILLKKTKKKHNAAAHWRNQEREKGQVYIEWLKKHIDPIHLLKMVAELEEHAKGDLRKVVAALGTKPLNKEQYERRR